MVDKSLFSSVKNNLNSKDNWETPVDLYNDLDNVFHFTLDPAASHENHKCDKYYTEEDNGLEQPWDGETVFLNCPYSDIKSWAAKADRSWRYGKATVVMLIPARTDTKYFQELFWSAKYIVFLKGRLKFLIDGIPSENSAPFPSTIVVLTWNEYAKELHHLMYNNIKKTYMGKVIRTDLFGKY